MAINNLAIPHGGLVFGREARAKPYVNLWLGSDLGFRVLGVHSTDGIIENHKGTSKALMAQFTNLLKDGDMQKLNADDWPALAGATRAKVIDGVDGNVQVLEVSDTVGSFGVNQALLVNDIAPGTKLILFVEGKSDGVVRVFPDVRFASQTIYAVDESLSEFDTEYTTCVTRHVVPLEAEGEFLTVRILATGSGSFWLRNVLLVEDPSNLSNPKIDSRSSLLSGPQVTIGASPISSNVFTSVSSLEEREVTISISNIDRYFSDMIRTGYFRERFIGRVSFVEQGFLDSGVKRVAFIGRCVRYSMSRDEATIVLRGT